MKITAAILAIFILLMPCQPLVAGISCMVIEPSCYKEIKCSHEGMRLCCMNKHRQEKEKPAKGCDKKNCPFEVCNCCCYIVIERSAIEIPFMIIPSKATRISTENIFSSYLSECWHPPEIV